MKARVGLTGVLAAVVLVVGLVFGAPRVCAAEPISLTWPVAGQMSGTYQPSHQGIDIAAPAGTPVVAAGPGTVVYAGWKDNGGGFVVDIDHGGGLLTSYNHLSDIVVGAGPVATGQLIGHVGSSGNATGPHLHFGFQIGGTWVNPLGYLPVVGDPGAEVPDTAICG